MGKSSKERTNELKEQIKDNQYAMEVDLKIQQEILSENLFHLKFYEKQIKSGESILKSDKFEDGYVPMDMLLQSAFKIRQAIQNGIMILKHKHKLDEKQIAKILEDCKDGNYYNFLTI